jgi:hypothetical protein
MTDREHRRRTGAQRGPWQTELVEGDPLPVEGRELVPLVRVTTRVRRRASLHSDGVGGQGSGLVHMRPVAILDRGEDGRVHERHQIRSRTARAIGGLALTALLVPCLAMVLVYLGRRLIDRRSPRASA